MDKDCRCGRTMELELRSVVWKRVVELRHVPVFHCHECGRDELLPLVTPLIKKVIKQRSDLQAKGKLAIDIAEHSDLTDILVEMAQKEIQADRLPEMIQKRIDELLDLFNVAQQSGDHEWLQSIRQRLQHLAS